MKRVSERQLTKDDIEDDGDEVAQEGFRKADQSALAARPMRGLPKRSTIPSSASLGTVNGGTSDSMRTDPPEPSTSPVKFGSFSGFGNGSNASTFSFKPSPSPTAPQVPSFPSPSPPANGSPPTPQFSSNTAKTFASLIKNTSAASSGSPEPDNSPEYKYYTSLRGLNNSLLSACTKAINEDPFVDLSAMLDQYKFFRTNVQKDFDDRHEKASASPTPAPPPAVPASKPVGMPAPPASFAGFGGTTSSTPSTKPSTGGFTPSFGSSSSSSSSSPFRFPSSSSGASDLSSKSAFGSTIAPTSPPKPFGSAMNSQPEGTPESKSSASSIGLGKPSTHFGGSSSAPSIFGSSDKPSAPPINSFSLPIKDSSSSPFGNPGTSAFGSSSTSTSSNPFAAPEKSDSTSTTPKPSAFGGFGGFGKPAESSSSLGNSVGFGFGSSASKDSGSGTEFSFAKPSASSFSAAPGGDSQETVATEVADENADSEAKSSILLGTSPHDTEGEGEEDEDTVHSIKLKAYRLKKQGEQGDGWVDLGAGVLRLKKHKETSTRRMLLRNSSTGKININFNLYSGLKPSLSKKAITFVGHDDGISQTFSVRTKTEEQAKELKDALDREIEFVKAKDSS